MPTVDISSVAAVEASAASTPKVSAKITIAPTTKKSVSPAGRALSRTFVVKCPLTLLWFGSSERKKAGTPMVNIEMSEIWDGCSG